MAKKTLTVEGANITLLAVGEGDYISLTDIDAKFDGGNKHIENWLKNQNTIEYLTTWELLHNPNFNFLQMQGIRENIGINRFLLSAKKWIETTNAIGIRASTDRYGGTYAHPDIAFHFCLWISPTFQLYVSKEFQRLKQKEAKEEQQSLDWSLKRTLSKINYRIHTDAIKMYLIPPLKGNIRDYATAEQLLVLVNLENLNAHLIKQGTKQQQRLE